MSSSSPLSSETRFASFLFREAVDPMLVYPLDADGRALPYIEANDAALAFYGYTREELQERSIYDLADAPRAEVDAALARLRTEPDVIRAGYQRRRDGTRVPVEVHARLVELDGRDVVLAVVRDLRPRLEAEARELQQSERLRALADAALAITAARTLEEKLQVITDEARRLIGAHQAVTSLTERTDGATDWSQAINAVSLSERYAEYAGYERKPDGSGIYAEVCRTNRPMRLTQEELEAHPAFRHFGTYAAEHPPIQGWLGVPLVGQEGGNLGLIQLSDKEGGPFTEDDEAVLVQLAQLASVAIESARAEADRLEAAERFRLIVSQALVGVAQTDLEGRFTYVNERYAEITGYPIEELIGRTMQSITHPDDLGRNLPSFHQAASGGAPFAIEKRYLRKDGEVIWVNNHVSSLLNAEGRPFAILAVSLDVTQRHVQEEALRASEARFRFLAEAMPQKVFIADAGGEVTYLNADWQAFTGLPERELKRWGWTQVIHPEDVEENVRRWRTAVESGSAYEIEHRFRRHDGAWRWHITRALPMRDETGRITMWFGSNTDVHDLKATQQRLRFLANLDQASYTLDDPDEFMALSMRQLGTYLGANRCLYAEVTDDEDHITVFGDYTHEAQSVVGTLRVSAFGSEALRLLREGRPYIFDDVHQDSRITPDDMAAYRAIEAEAGVCVPLYKGGRFLAVIAVHQKTPRVWTADEIELIRVVVGRTWEALLRTRALRALRTSEARYRALTELAPHLVYTARPDGSIDFYNQQWYDYTGMAPEDSLDGWVEMVHPEHRRRAQEAFMAAVRTETDYEVEFPLRGRDGTYRWHIDRARPLRDESGQVVRWIGVAVDTHDRIEAQEQLEALNASLEARVAERTAVAEDQARQIRRLAAELTRAEQKERRRIATTLHDHLQQLLAAARFHLQSAAEATPALARVDGLIAESIEVSRSLTVQLSPPVLHEAGLGAGLAWLARWMEQAHGLSVRLELVEDAEPEDEHVRVLLFEAVRELLFNVTKHAGAEEAVVTTQALAHGRLRITVEDDGVGFASPGSTSLLSGLGLPSIRERMSYVGGEVQIHSQPGQGTHVTLFAPLLAAASLDLGSGLPSPARRDGDPPSGSAPDTIRVLLVDDHAILRAGLSSLLRDEPGIEIVGEAGDGVEAVDLAVTLNPDVILMDVTMPRMNGIEATQRILEKRPDARIIGLSMHTEEDMADRLRQAGATTYLTKGGPPTALLKAIRGMRDE